MTASAREVELKALLDRYIKAGAIIEAPSATEIKLLAESLAPDQPRSEHALAYLCLSKVVSSNAQSTSSSSGSRALQTNALQYVQELFADSTTDLYPPDFVPFASLISSLFPLDPVSANALLTQQLSISTAKDTIDDPLAILLEAAELPSPLQPILADLLAQAAGTKLGRELTRTRAEEWLRGAVEIRDNAELSSVCAVALSKLNEEIVPGQEGQQDVDITTMCDRMVQAIKIGHGESLAIRSSLEGLAVISSRPAIRQRLADDADFLDALIALSPIPRMKGGSLPITPRASMDIVPEMGVVDTALCYGICTILINLTSPKAVLSAEDEQAAKLRAMALSGKRNTSEVAKEDPLELDEAVSDRVAKVVKAGGISGLAGLVRADSQTVKEGLGRLCLNLVQEQVHRMPFIRDGGFKVLSTVIRNLSSASTQIKSAAQSPTSPTALLPAAQALAKLAITTPPHLLFPPPTASTCLDALTPLFHLLSDAASSLLQRFESLMALTNIASIEPSIAGRIVDAKIEPTEKETLFRGTGREHSIRVFHKVEECLINDNTLVRRAATELICNLVSCQRGFVEYTTTGSARTSSRLRLLAILTNSDDLATRLAAGGALAILTESPEACACLVGDQERSIWSRMVMLMDYQDEEEDEDGNPIPVISNQELDQPSIHRAAVILHSLVEYCTTLKSANKDREVKRLIGDGVQDSLMRVLRSKVAPETLEPVVECLKLLKQIA